MPSTTRLVEVPIKVSVPPSTAMIDSGMSSFLALTPVTSASFIMMGMSTTTTGVLFRKAEAKSAPTRTSTIASRGCFSARFMIASATRWITPVRMSAPDNTNIAPMTIGAELEKTE